MTSRFAVTIEGRRHFVALDEREGKLRVVVDQRERTLDARRLDEGLWSVLDGTDARLIQVDGSLPKLTVEVSHPDGEPRLCTVEVEVDGDGEATAGQVDDPTRGGRKPPSGAGATSARSPASAAPAGPVTVRSPIPGRVVKVLVKPGDVVEAGQALLILEAMKMENELRAPRAGTVSLVHAGEGTAVDSGQDLVSLV